MQYVQLRAEGKSYEQIARELNISKSTCTEWERALAAQIDEVKRAKLNELIEAYGMTKEARIKNLGDTLEKIDKALQAADFSQVDIDKLLTLKLKYAEQLKAESLPLTAAKQTEIKDAKLQAIRAAAGFFSVFDKAACCTRFNMGRHCRQTKHDRGSGEKGLQPL